MTAQPEKRRPLRCMIAVVSLWMATAGQARTPTDLPMNTPAQTLNVLYTDLAGLLGPRDAVPRWPDYLSVRASALRERMLALETADGRRSLRLDWLCLCVDPHHLKVPPLLVTYPSDDGTRAEVNVRLNSNAGWSRRLRVFLVREDGGWRIDDIENDGGARFSDAMARAIDTHLRGRAPLP